MKKLNYNIKSKKIEKKIDNILEIIQKNNTNSIIDILGDKREILKRNLIAGISRGVGIGIGVTIITAMLIMFLNHLVTLNIPIMGQYISDIVEIVERNRY